MIFYTTVIMSTVQVLCLSIPPPACYLAPATGRCRANMPSYYYDQNTDSCRTFNYGGCGGNGNKFETEDTCKDTCAQGLRQGTRKMEAGESTTEKSVESSSGTDGVDNYLNSFLSWFDWFG
eukprot:GFUD01093099.1.p1 GENE.GFUD01093099.1~~GFUD01093099.1.p1  ORF type:complete len:121 (+),score=27.26 GFUD01093099.1:82-444(+)